MVYGDDDTVVTRSGRSEFGGNLGLLVMSLSDYSVVRLQ